MLPRVLEPEVMDSIRDAVEYDSMDHVEVNRLFVDDLAAAGLVRGEILDLGTGTALVAIELCRRLPEIEVWAIDQSEAMLDVAKANLVLARLAERIHLDWLDAKDLSYDDGRFAAVISNSLVHHVAEPGAVLREAWRVAAPGGLVFFRDLVRPGDEPTLARLVDTYAAGANDRQRQLFADSLRAALRLDEVRELIDRIGLPASDVQQTSDRHWTWIARKPT